MIDVIKKRRSIRTYSTKDVSDEIITELIKAGLFAPQSKHNKAVHFIVIRDKESKEFLYKLLGQGYLKQAPVLIIPLIDTIKSTSPVEDLSVASQNIFLQAVDLGLGTVWKKVPEALRKDVAKKFKIPLNFLLINIIPVGYPKKLRRAHSDKDFSKSKIHYEKW